MAGVLSCPLRTGQHTTRCSQMCEGGGHSSEAQQAALRQPDGVLQDWQPGEADWKLAADALAAGAACTNKPAAVAAMSQVLPQNGLSCACMLLWHV